MSETQRVIYLKDYQPTSYLIQKTDLNFDLYEDYTEVHSTLQIKRREGVQRNTPLRLDGEALELVAVAVDRRVLDASEYQLDDQQLVLSSLPDQFTLSIKTRIDPQRNTELSGLYKSSGNFCTQCEAEGFRRITYYLDRPDVMSVFSIRISANKQHFPVLLSNGNLVDSGETEQGRHWVSWHDPFPKPSYLFALVAGDLAHIHDQFTTMTGREVDLYIYVQAHNIDQCDYAMASLKRAMAWDEQTYGREYDLDRYMIVAVDDFNMGAMENKGLNVFNSKYVLAKPETATDSDYQHIEGVIGHEYFHNWSGNRVTCRDWFQLSLKEGFTVFRDQEFSADMQSRGVKRIQDINMLRTHQFREDTSPMAHPIRPDSYVEINNFYTVTVYEKGGEVVRMLQGLLGKTQFRKGCDLYFQRHDGQAVTTEDFVKAMEDASGVDLQQFRLWYSQAGTPELQIEMAYDNQARRCTLHVRQRCQPSPGQAEKQPMHIPLAIGLLDKHGRDMPFILDNQPIIGSAVLQVTETEQVFHLDQVNEPPTPSLLRQLSAPVKLTSNLTDQQHYFLMAHDSDDFSRWDAGQQLAVKNILNIAEAIERGETATLAPKFIDTLEKVLSKQQADKADKAMMALELTLPTEGYLSEFVEPINPAALHQAREFVRREIAQTLQQPLYACYAANLGQGEYHNDPQSIAQRKLKNCCLHYLMELDDPQINQHCWQQYQNANNMTDTIEAMAAMVNTHPQLAGDALNHFYSTWQGENLVIDKWFSLQATSKLPGTLDRVMELTRHPDFKLTNPNRLRSLIGAFCQGNSAQFHDESGRGYQLLREFIVKLNQLNPQVAARMVTPLISWKKYTPSRQRLMKQELETIMGLDNLSKDVSEIVSRSLV